MAIVIIVTMILFYIVLDRDENRETKKMKERENDEFTAWIRTMDAELREGV